MDGASLIADNSKDKAVIIFVGSVRKLLFFSSPFTVDYCAYSSGYVRCSREPDDTSSQGSATV